MLGSSRPHCTRPGSLPLRASKPPNGIKNPLRRDVAVTTENATSALPEIGDHDDVGLVIAGARFDPCLPLTHLVGSSHVCVPISTADFQTAELVDQEEVDHAGDRVGTVHGRGAILQDVHVINHRKWYQVDVRAAASPAATANEPYATRLPSIKTKVSFGNRPRRLN